jgi:hypothetical protein
MSISTLKKLTISNTARNQEYLFAKLKTEVIRKEGARPERQVVKVVQSEKEDQMKERAERAIRRARRSSEDMISNDIEGGCSDVGYSEDRSGESIPLPKHSRGPGDESDYDTSLLRRVKWDRVLFTSVYLDEVKLGTRQPFKESRSLKGIIAPTAKVCYS